MQEKFGYNDILCMPEFLREGKIYTDIINQNGVIIGGNKITASKVLWVYQEVIEFAIGNPDFKMLNITSAEAEVVKFFSNTYLTMRVAFLMKLTHL